MRMHGPVLSWSLLALLHSACGSGSGSGEPLETQPRVFAEPDAGSRVALSAHQLLLVKLRSQSSTGYTWTVQEIDPRLLELDRREHLSAEQPGGIDLETLVFAGTGAGHTRLTLVYRRPWQAPTSADPTYSLELDIAGPYTRVRATPLRSSAAVKDHPAAAAPQGTRYNICDPGDGTLSGCTPIKDQGPCGACWAFATAGVMENLIHLVDPGRTPPPDLSEQYLLSCNQHGWTCGGGTAAFHYYSNEFANPPESTAGTVYEGDFPYQGQDGACGTLPHPHHEKLKNWSYLFLGELPSVATLKQAIQTYGPTMVSVCADSAFTGYTGGIFHGDGCTSVNHGVVLVGWDDNGGDGYWFLRNSWGPGWGEHGYMRISYGANVVGEQATLAAYEPYVPSNQPPFAHAGHAQAVNAGAAVALDGELSFDPDGTIAGHAWTQTGGPAATLTSAGTARAAFVAPTVTATAPLAFRLTVTDNAGATASAEVTVTVHPPPLASAGPGQVVNAGVTVTLDGSGSSGVEASIVSYSWTQSSGPAVMLIDANTARPTFVAPSVTATTALAFRLTVTDDLGATASADVTVTLHAAPVADAGPAQLVNAGVTVTLDGSGSSGVEASIVSYSWVQTSGPAVTLIDANTAHPTFVAPSVEATTALTFQLTVTDDMGASASATATVTLHALPLANAGIAQEVTEGATATLDGNGSSAVDASIIGYAWAQISGPAVALAGATNARATFLAPAVPASTELAFALTVTDDRGATASSTATVTVVPDPATVTVVPDPARVSGKTSGGGCSSGGSELAPSGLILWIAAWRRRRSTSS